MVFKSVLDITKYDSHVTCPPTKAVKAQCLVPIKLGVLDISPRGVGPVSPGFLLLNRQQDQVIEGAGSPRSVLVSSSPPINVLQRRPSRAYTTGIRARSLKDS